MKKFSIPSIIRLVLLTIILSLFFACSSSGEKEESIENEWELPTQYQNIPIEQIKSQIEITEYKTMKGAATDAGTEDMATPGYEPSRSSYNKSLTKGGGAAPQETAKNKADREALAQYTNKLISLEGVVALTGSQKTSPLYIQERKPGKYDIWFCDKTRKPCRYQALLLYNGPEGKGDTLFTNDNRIRFWGVILGEEIKVLRSSGNYKRYPKILVIDLEVSN